jgi:biotin carboxylase
MNDLKASLAALRIDRAAIARMQRCLDEVVVEGINASVPLHREILRAPAFRGGCVDTGFLERHGVMDQGMRAVS